MKRMFVILYFVAIISLFCSPSDVLAHANLANSNPQQESGMNQPPHEIRLQFTEKINVDISKVILKDSSGKIVNTKQSSEDGEWLILSVATLPKDVYKVDWQVLSVDSHVTEGSFRFAVGMELAKIRPAETVSLDDATAASPTSVQPLDQSQQPTQPTQLPQPDQPVSNGSKAATVVTQANPTNSANTTTTTKNATIAVENRTNQTNQINQTQEKSTIQDQGNISTSLPAVPSKQEPAGTDAVKQSISAPTLTTSAHDHSHSHPTAHDHQMMVHQEHQHNHSSGWLRVMQILAAVSVGSFLFLRLWPGYMKIILESSSSFAQLERKVFYLAILVFLLLDGAQITLLAAQLGSLTNQIGATIISIFTSSFVGAALLIRLVAMVGFIWLTYQQWAQTSHHWLRGILFVGLIIPFQLTGHMMTVDMFWGISHLAHMIHFGAATVWIGGIIGLVYLSLSKDTKTQQLLNLARQFSKVALTSVVLMIVSGFALSSFKLHSFEELLYTSYGNVLLWKVAAFVVTLVIASVLRFVILPSVTATMNQTTDEERSIGSLIWCLGTELAAAIGIFILAGLLATTAPPM